MDAAAKRRSVYTIKDTDAPLAPNEIESIVKQALEKSPSPWNVSSSRAIVRLTFSGLLGLLDPHNFADSIWRQSQEAVQPDSLSDYGGLSAR